MSQPLSGHLHGYFVSWKRLAAIALSLSVLMAGAWLVQQRTGNSGWVDTIWTFSLGLVGAGQRAVAGGGRGAERRGNGWSRPWWRSGRSGWGSHIAVRTAGITDDPRYAAFASEWGVDSPRRMFVFLQNQGFGSIPLVFAIFVAARFPQAALRLQDYLGVLILLVGIAGEALADAPAQALPWRSRQQGPGLRCRAVALVAASELFLRMVRLARLSGDRDFARLSAYYPWGWATLAGAGLHVLDPGARHRHPAAGSADAALARRALPRLSVAHQRVLSAAAAQGSGRHELRLQRDRHRRTGAAAGPRRFAPRSSGCARAPRHGSPMAMPKATPRSPTKWRRAPSPNIPTRPTPSITRCRRHSSAPCSARTANIPPASTRQPAITLQEAEEEALRQTVDACRSGRRPIDPRTRLRLGFAVAVDGAAVSEFAGRRGVEFAFAARIYRGPRPRRAD